MLHPRKEASQGSTCFLNQLFELVGLLLSLSDVNYPTLSIFITVQMIEIRGSALFAEVMLSEPGQTPQNDHTHRGEAENTENGLFSVLATD
jgi:hypothetical protein